jgi:hypothetical protein
MDYYILRTACSASKMLALGSAWPFGVEVDMVRGEKDEVDLVSACQPSGFYTRTSLATRAELQIDEKILPQPWDLTLG